MKKLLYILFLLFAAYHANAQTFIPPTEDTFRYFKNSTQYGQKILRGWFPTLLRIPDTINADRPKIGGAIASNGIDKIYLYDGTKWNPLTNTTIIVDSSGNGIPRDTLQGGPFSSVPQVGFNPGSNLTPAQVVQAAFYSSQPPTATLTGGQNLELMGDGDDLPFTLNWTAGRNFATQPLQSILVAGVSKSFAQPAVNSSVSGTHAITTPRNTNNTFVIEVTTTDGKITQASTQFNWFAKRYAGWNATNNPDDSQLLSGLVSEAATTPAKGTANALWNVPAPTGGPKYFFYAYPSEWGDLQHFILNGFESLNSFTKIQRNVQNASGFVQEYNIYISNNQLGFGLSNQVY